MGLHKKAINAILNLSSQERYEHTLKRITDSGVLYVLAGPLFKSFLLKNLMQATACYVRTKGFVWATVCLWLVITS